MIRALLFISLLAPAIASDAPRVLKRTYISAEPPSASDKPADENFRVIRRVYRRIDQNESVTIAPKNDYFFFAGASVDYFSRNRKIEIKTKNNGDVVKVGSRYVRADGSNYSMDKRSDDGAANAEFGFLSAETIYYGAKLGLLDDFAELSAFAGVPFESAAIADFVPFAQISIGAGYDDFDDGIKPDNLSLSAGAGAERALIGDRLHLRVLVFYRYRFWRTLEKHYGDEYWRDGETGASVGLRYKFYR
ncbi:MAG: hypothetical protein LBI57_00790 [Helicobacteraceae bacterium]|jgi:hypothetical protein|nr:hypothetical protein [Helicobacteraceae bacterium]